MRNPGVEDKPGKRIGGGRKGREEPPESAILGAKRGKSLKKEEGVTMSKVVISYKQ